MVIYIEWSSGTNLKGGATFTKVLIKRAKLIINQKINFPRDRKQHIHEIEMNNGWNTQVVQILRGKHDGRFFSKEKL